MINLKIAVLVVFLHETGSMVRFLPGQIDGKRTIEMMSVILPAFFDNYLKEKREIDVIRKARAYSEIEIVTNADLSRE